MTYSGFPLKAAHASCGDPKRKTLIGEDEAMTESHKMGGSQTMYSPYGQNMFCTLEDGRGTVVILHNNSSTVMQHWGKHST